MRVRARAKDGDYVLGIWYSDSIQVTAQIVADALNLFKGEWFLDSTWGLPINEILGYQQQSRDLIIKDYILGCATVTSIDSFDSTITNNREYQFVATITSVYGTTQITNSIQL